MARRCLIILLLVAVTLGVFWQTRDYGFVWDDDVNVKKNPYFHPVTVPNVVQFWQTPYWGLYIPLTYTVWGAAARFARLPGADRTETRLDPRLFHTMNLVLHLLSGLVVLQILKKLGRDDWSACAGASLFALHPLQVEPVAWITGMKDLLCGFCSLLAVWQYLAFARLATAPLRDQESKKVSHRSGKRLHFALATMAFLLAMLAKPTAVVLPVAAWFLDRWALGRTAKQATTALIGWAALALPIVLWTQAAQPQSNLDFIAPLWARPLVAGDALGFYLYKLAVPVSLGPDYGRSPEFVLQHGWVYLTGVLPWGLAVLIGLWRDRLPGLVAPAGVFLAGLLPTLGLVPFGFQHISTVADRYLYISMLGPALLLANIMSGPWGNLRSAKMVCALYIGSLTFGSALQAAYWRNAVTLFRHTLEVNRQSWVAHNNLGNALLDDGRLEPAIAHYQNALRIEPRFAMAYYNLGNALANQGRLDEAVVHYSQALRLEPDYADARFNLGNTLARLRMFEEATAQYLQALRLSPGNPDVHLNLGNVLLEQGRLDDAISQYSSALRIKPDHEKARRALSLALDKKTAAIPHD